MYNVHVECTRVYVCDCRYRREARPKRSILLLIFKRVKRELFCQLSDLRRILVFSRTALTWKFMVSTSPPSIRNMSTILFQWWQLSKCLFTALCYRYTKHELLRSGILSLFDVKNCSFVAWNWLKLAFLESLAIKEHSPELNSGIKSCKDLSLFW